MSVVIKSYTLNHQANPQKVQKLISLHKEYILAARQFRLYLIKLVMMGKRPSEFDSYYHQIDSPLSKRYRQVCQRQVVGMFKSWQSNFHNAIEKMIIRCVDDKLLRGKVLFIHRFQIFKISDAPNFFPKKKVEISEEDIVLYKALRRKVFRRWSYPRVDHINIQMSALVAEVSPSQNSTFDYWINIATLEKGKRVLIPVQSHSYFEETKGQISQGCNLIVKKGQVDLRLVKIHNVDYRPSQEIVSLDFGISTLFSSQYGDQYGQNFKEKLFEYDQKITRLAANLQRQGKSPKQSRRYRKLISKIRNFIKNETNRCLNAIVSKFSPRELVVEKLDFRESHLSRKMNRIVSKCGRKFIKEKLEYLEGIGLKVTSVNPMYSSQECSRCQNIDKNNRKNKIYRCDKCGLHLDADVNGARNLVMRRSHNFFLKYTSKQETRQFLESRYSNLPKKELVRKMRSHYSWSRSSLIRSTA